MSDDDSLYLSNRPGSSGTITLDGELKDALIYTIANHMKKCFLNWNKDTVEDKVIFNHLYELSGGKISLNSEKHVLSPSENLIRMSNKRFGKSGRNNKHKKYRSQKQRWK